MEPGEGMLSPDAAELHKKILDLCNGKHMGTVISGLCFCLTMCLKQGGPAAVILASAGISCIKDDYPEVFDEELLAALVEKGKKDAK